MYIHNYKYIYKLFVLLGIFIKMTLVTQHETFNQMLLVLSFFLKYLELQAKRQLFTHCNFTLCTMNLVDLKTF